MTVETGRGPVIRPCREADFEAVLAIINAAAVAYRGAIPDDCWSDPYMPAEELARERGAGVAFWGYEDGDELLGVMGLQRVGEVGLIRHAYVRSAHQRRGIGAKLLEALVAQSETPLLVGTWAAARWAVRFYEGHGFRLVPLEEKDALLGRYWTITPRQMERSVVLADQRWWGRRGAGSR